jgi:hypothetical protein
MNTDTFWQVAAELTLAAVDQHMYTWSLLMPRFPKTARAAMYRGDKVLSNLRSELESEMFRSGGPQDINVFYPPNREPPRLYPQPLHRGDKRQAMSNQEWREVAEEMDRCLSRIILLLKHLSGNVPATTLDQAIKYHDTILRAKMALEPYARKDLGDWSVLYPRGGAP